MRFLHVHLERDLLSLPSEVCCTAQQACDMALGGASAKSSPAAGMKRKSAEEPTKKGKAKKEESSDSSRCLIRWTVAERFSARVRFHCELCTFEAVLVLDVLYCR